MEAMATLELTIKKKSNRVAIEMDADRFEKLAADFGLFSEDFMESLRRADRDVKAGRLTRIRSLEDVRD